MTNNLCNTDYEAKSCQFASVKMTEVNKGHMEFSIGKIMWEVKG